METYKIQTLQKMLEQEKLNLERLKGETNNPSYKLSEANIRKLREQLRQVGAEVSACVLLYCTSFFVLSSFVVLYPFVSVYILIYIHIGCAYIRICMYNSRCRSSHVNIHTILFFIKYLLTFLFHTHCSYVHFLSVLCQIFFRKISFAYTQVLDSPK